MKRRSRTKRPPEETFFVDRDLAGKRFLEILREAGVQVEDHNDHFGPTTPDVEWLSFVARKGWVALTHNRRIRQTSHETWVLMESGVRVLILIGKAPQPELAENFVRSLPGIRRFLRRQKGPFIAKVTRPSERGRRLGRAGRVEMWLSYEDWRTNRAVD